MAFTFAYTASLHNWPLLLNTFRRSCVDMDLVPPDMVTEFTRSPADAHFVTISTIGFFKPWLQGLVVP